MTNLDGLSLLIDKIIRLLGQGTFGKVVEAWDRDMRMKVAVKIIRAIQKYRLVPDSRNEDHWGHTDAFAFTL